SKTSRPCRRLTRRDFLKTATTVVAAGSMIGRPSDASTSSSARVKPSESFSVIPESHEQRLMTGWEYRKGGLGGPWEMWRKAADDTVTWQPVELPHCFNALDAVDPDVTYYQGPGWYRTRLKIENPFPKGRTLL